MPLPITFANLPAGDNPASLLDTQFAAVAGFTVIPCSATGQNIIQLRPFLDAPVVSQYSDLSPVFTFAATESSTGDVTLNVNGLGEFVAFKANGAVIASAGDLQAGLVYQAAFFSGLNHGAGGFVVNVGGGGGGGGGGVIPGGPDVANVILSTFLVSGLFTPGPNLIIAIVEGMGGGGGGGNAGGPTNTALGGGGGGSGAWFRAMLTPAQIGPSQPVTIGIGGGPEIAGTATSFGALCIAGGGAPGVGNNSTDAFGPGGIGGVASPLGGGAAGIALNGMPGQWGQSFIGTFPFVVLSGTGGGTMGGGAPAQSIGGVGARAGFQADSNSGGGGSGAVAWGGGAAAGGNGANGWLQVTAYYSAP